MKLKYCTITGADDNTNHDDLFALSKQYPFCEWGILLSSTKVGNPKFPSPLWMAKLAELKEATPINLSGHICGAWVRQVCAGNWRFLNSTFDMFGRLQLNFSPYIDRIESGWFMAGLRGITLKNLQQIIFQLKTASNPLLRASTLHIDRVPLFDRSGGKGVLPGEWPKPAIDGLVGYAGGLSPENLEDQLILINEAVGDREIWIDTESKVRTDDKLDLNKVEKFLEIAAKYA